MAELHCSNSSCLPESDSALTHGWVQQCNGRGTLDIIQSCIITLIFCSWSVLCLNVPESTGGRRGFLRYKLWWTMIALIFPEVITGIAGEQWRAATQCREEFLSLGHSQWSMRKAFFANMGGFVLESPDFPQFPIDGQQLAYLVRKKYLDLPTITEDEIRDKNKADGSARMITCIQMCWFSVQCLGRAFQHLGLSTLELTVIANIFGTIFTFFFWNHKPLDVEGHFVLRTSTPISRILVEAGEQAREPYSRTPLDFVKSSRKRPNLTTTCWLGLQTMFDVESDPPGRPIRSIGNTVTLPPGSYKAWDVMFFIFFPLSFFGIHLIAWKFEFPTSTESLIWRIATVSLVTMNLCHFQLVYIYIYYPQKCGLALAGKPTKDIWEFYAVAPRWLIYATHWFGMVVYLFARLYILTEGWVGLRALPKRVYLSVNWSNYIPHA